MVYKDYTISKVDDRFLVDGVDEAGGKVNLVAETLNDAKILIDEY